MTTESDQLQQLVTAIADMLEEKRPAARKQIGLVVRTIGAPNTINLLREVLAIEQQGGMLTLDKQRRRTVGGVFFHLVKEQYGQDLPRNFYALGISKGKKEATV